MAAKLAQIQHYLSRSLHSNFLKNLTRNLPNALPGAVAIAAIMVVRFAGTFQVAEWFVFDRFMRYRLPEQIDNRIIIVGITERDIPQAGFPITDSELAKLIKKINSFQPKAIGLDIFRDLPVASGRQELAKLFQQTKNLVVIEKSVLPDDHNTFINPPPELPAEQVGFADILLDADGNIRRSLLAGSGRLSFAAKLSTLYLQAENWNLENGVKDKAAFRFVSKNDKNPVELQRFQANDGGYIRSDSFGNQILLNWRNSDRFPILSLYDRNFNRNLQYKSIYDPDFDPSLIRDRIVLVGYIAPFSAKDTITVPAVSDRPIYGVEFHAYSISQILSTVLDGRGGINSLPEGLEYLAIAIAGLVGIWISTRQISASRVFMLLSAACGTITFICYLAILGSWWLPVVPTVIACGVAGMVTRYVNDLRSLIVKTQELSAQRQQTLDEAFNALHNGPLHSLAELIGKARQNELETNLSHKLENLDRELRQVYETLRPDSMQQEILAPLHELVAEVMHKALQRDFIGYKQLKFTIPDIHPVDDRALTAQQKRELCSFLDEALCNVGKHAIGSTRLRIVCKQENQMGYLQVIDNGAGIQTDVLIKPRGGTNHAMQLAKQMGGHFRREPHPPKGTICEISWSIFGK
jgi:CHASE2 domain-containing sensor protein